MERKDLKIYEAPACEVVELKASTSLLAGSPTNAEDVNVTPPEVDPNED